MQNLFVVLNRVVIYCVEKCTQNMADIANLSRQNVLRSGLITREKMFGGYEYVTQPKQYN